MCGRYTLFHTGADIARTFQTLNTIDVAPRYNVAPTQQMPVIRVNDEGHRVVHRFQWGLVPSWADDPKIGNRMINARAETVASKPAFRSSFRHRRCLIPADGFYEWRTENGKQPYFIGVGERELFAFAGLWERWLKGDTELHTFTIITGPPNSKISELHDRMPVILPPEAYPDWLDPKADDLEALNALLIPYQAEQMWFYPVSRQVNKPTDDHPGLIAPLAR
jgi:putative SOS response-associated peptidase YedK